VRVRACTGTIDAIRARAGDALADPNEDLLARVRTGGAVNMDETGWRLKGAQRTLWGAFTDRYAVLIAMPCSLSATAVMRITLARSSPIPRR
jgi:hypothetical protein